jgi:hypothetical protein
MQIFCDVFSKNYLVDSSSLRSLGMTAAATAAAILATQYSGLLRPWGLGMTAAATAAAILATQYSGLLRPWGLAMTAAADLGTKKSAAGQGSHFLVLIPLLGSGGVVAWRGVIAPAGL